MPQKVNFDKMGLLRARKLFVIQAYLVANARLARGPTSRDPNEPFPSFPKRLDQNQSSSETIHLKMNMIFMKVNVQVKYVLDQCMFLGNCPPTSPQT